MENNTMLCKIYLGIVTFYFTLFVLIIPLRTVLF